MSNLLRAEPRNGDEEEEEQESVTYFKSLPSDNVKALLSVFLHFGVLALTAALHSARAPDRER